MNNYVIGVGLKGQNVVMKEINAIKKAGATLAKKKITANVVAKVSAVGAAASGAAGSASSKAATPQFDAKQYISQAKQAGEKARDVFGQAMTGGASGIANALPGIGSLFSASQSAVGSAAQEFVTGVSTSKNIQLITANFQKAFGNAMDGAFKNSMFAGRQNQAVYANLAEQGVRVETLAKRENVNALDQFARAQGVGSLDELFQRAQSGQLKEKGGFSKGDIEYAKSITGLLNNRYSADIGYQSFIELIKRKKPEIDRIAGTKTMRSLAGAVRGEGNIQETEQNYQVTAASTIGNKGYLAMTASRLADLKIRAKTIGAAAKIEAFKNNATEVIVDTFDEMASGKNMGKRADQILLEKGLKKLGVNIPEAGPALPGGGEAKPEGSDAGGGAPLSQSNNDLSRAGAELANTINQITRQLMAAQYQFRTRGA